MKWTVIKEAVCSKASAMHVLAIDSVFS